MARKPSPKTSTKPDEIAADDAQDRGEADVLSRLDAEFSDSADADWTARVYKIMDAPGQKGGIVGWLFDSGIGDLSAVREKLAGEEGPGRYRIMVQKDGKRFGQYDITILRDLRPKVAAAAQIAPTAPADGMSAFERAFLQMMERSERHHSELMAAIAQQQAAIPQRTGITDIEQVASLLKSVRDIASPEQSGLTMFREGMALMKEIGIGKAGETNIADLALAAIERLPDVLATIQQQGGQAPQQQPAAMPVPQLRGNGAAQDVQTEATARDSQPAANGPTRLPPQFTALKTFLLSKAQEQADPKLFGDFVKRQLGDAGLSLLERVDDPIEMLVAQFPDIAQYRQWFEQLLTSMEAPDDDDAGEQLADQRAD